MEFGKLLKDYVDPNITQAEIKEFFGIADLSGDKKLDKKELLTLYRTLIKYWLIYSHIIMKYGEVLNQ